MKTVKIGKRSIDIVGRFSLEVRADKNKFQMTNIDAFIPSGGTIKDKVQFLSKVGLINSVFISKLITIFYPDDDQLDAHNVDAFIRHHDVRIGGMSDADHDELVNLGLKKSNPKFILTNIDKVADDKHEEEIKLLQLRSMIYDENRPISKEQLIWLASTFGISYVTKIQDEVLYKKYLQKVLDKHIQSNPKDRSSFVEAIENWKMTEMRYYISEFILNGNVSDIGGIYKVGPKPIGASLNSVISYFENNPSEFQVLKDVVIDKYKNTVLS